MCLKNKTQTKIQDLKQKSGLIFTFAKRFSMNTKIIQFISIFLIGMALVSCGGNKKDDTLSTDLVNNTKSANGETSDGKPEMTFEKMVHDFGEILEGEVVSFNFKFKNTGNADLVISSHKTSCGCTVPEYPKGAIAPGEGGIITVQFNSKNKRGVQNKDIVFSTNCEPNNVTLSIKVIVKEP